jgi:carbamoyltransferase
LEPQLYDGITTEGAYHWVRRMLDGWCAAMGNLDPRRLDSPHKIRSTIKRRPAFQPFCPCVLKDAERAYIDNPKSVEGSFMIMAFQSTQRMEEEAPAGVFVDGNARVQIVNDDYIPQYYQLLKAFGNETGVPAVLNTSFNRSGEPIVRRPDEAIHDLISCRLDYLLIGNYLVNSSGH